jgi:hypothetical protein
VTTYLSLIPEALIASMLPPEEFGLYYAVGSARRSSGQALFFTVDRERLGAGAFDLARADDRCRPHPDGAPKRSVYLSVYRVLEHVPVDALAALHLTTPDGRVLSLAPEQYSGHDGAGIRLYQEFCPVTPRVASRLDATAFAAFITSPGAPVSVPRIVFCDLGLGALATDPDSPNGGDLPYANLGHLRACLREVAASPEKQTKVVERQLTQEVPFRTIDLGFFAGDPGGLVMFRMPDRDRLEREHYAWWRSAQATFGG